MHLSIYALIIATSIFSIVHPTLSQDPEYEDGEDSVNVVIPSCKILEERPAPKFLDYCQSNCYFLPSTNTQGFQQFVGAMFCDVPIGSLLETSRNAFEACRKSCIQPGSQPSQNTRLYIGQSEITDREKRQFGVTAIEGEGAASGVVQTTGGTTQSYGWPYCSSTLDCADSTLQALGRTVVCVLRWVRDHPIAARHVCRDE